MEELVGFEAQNRLDLECKIFGIDDIEIADVIAPTTGLLRAAWIVLQIGEKWKFLLKAKRLLESFVYYLVNKFGGRFG